jgi:hypothetical protein
MAAKPSGQSGHSIAFCTSEEILASALPRVVSSSRRRAEIRCCVGPLPTSRGQDCACNIKPDKERSSERIDGISALVNAPGRALLLDHSRFIYGNGRTMLILD